MPWLPRVLPNIMEITGARPERTIFTRFVPAKGPGQGSGMWRRYYERWSSMTIDELGPEMIDLVWNLARFVPPARTFDKHVYSPWTGSDLHIQLRNGGVDTVIVTGGETDVCVLATVLGAVDWGFPGHTGHRCGLQLRRRDPRFHDEYLHEPVRAAGGVRHDGNASRQLVSRRPREACHERDPISSSYSSRKRRAMARRYRRIGSTIF